MGKVEIKARGAKEKIGRKEVSFKFTGDSKF